MSSFQPVSEVPTGTASTGLTSAITQPASLPVAQLVASSPVANLNPGVKAAAVGLSQLTGAAMSSVRQPSTPKQLAQSVTGISVNTSVTSGAVLTGGRVTTGARGGSVPARPVVRPATTRAQVLLTQDSRPVKGSVVLKPVTTSPGAAARTGSILNSGIAQPQTIKATKFGTAKSINAVVTTRHVTASVRAPVINAAKLSTEPRSDQHLMGAGAIARAKVIEPRGGVNQPMAGVRTVSPANIIRAPVQRPVQEMAKLLDAAKGEPSRKIMRLANIDQVGSATGSQTSAAHIPIATVTPTQIKSRPQNPTANTAPIASTNAAQIRQTVTQQPSAAALNPIAALHSRVGVGSSLSDAVTISSAPVTNFNRPAVHGMVSRPVMMSLDPSKTIKYPSTDANIRDVSHSGHVALSSHTSSVVSGSVSPIHGSPVLVQTSPRPSILRKAATPGAAKRALTTFPCGPDGDAARSLSGSPKTSIMLADPTRENSQSSTDTVGSCDMSPLKRRWDDDSPQPPEVTSNAVGATPGELTPRKKRRKQLLTSKPGEAGRHSGSEDDLETFQKQLEHVTEVNLPQNNNSVEPAPHGDNWMDRDGVSWLREPLRLDVQKLLNGYSPPYKPRLNHFDKYSDLKSKEERLPTVSELSNQKNVKKMASGWKMHLVVSQLHELTEMETDRQARLSELMSRVMPLAVPLHRNASDELHHIRELTKGCLQRSESLKEQYDEARQAVTRLMTNTDRAMCIIAKHHSKRAAKKKHRS